ncbi:GNAT family N-acetyltransferase [Maribacter arenosus]|uniref:GNAT family N-acetyltransferase n=1 Tax=Maribacter arenosus TaxID=1854708 RepID=A0ABR7VBS5_9FLAO|nr:GNAT family N-acetyltransferase [Maribacter arenosus]MBD0849617.1 GNAT family N-acetyltransferase [Maribacter arenosus]
MTLTILQKEDITPIIKKQVHDLFKVLNADINQWDIEEVLSQGNEFICACCWEDEKLVGMASLATYKAISGYKGMVEDVVVSEAFRGQGLGRKLMERLIAESQNLHLSEILLFSGHHRKPAIALYKSLGFNLKNSGLYTLKL